MKKIKATALAMAVVMLVPLLMSCSKKSSKSKTVKADDPWYESYRFELERDQKPTEMLSGSVVTYSNGNVYHLYCLTNLADYDNYRRTILDTYDSNGKKINSFNIADPEGYGIDDIMAVRIKDDGITAEAVVTIFKTGGFATAVLDIDLTNGSVGKPKLLTNKPGEPLEIPGEGISSYGVATVFIAGNYNIPMILAGESAVEVQAHAFVFDGAEYLCELDFTGMPRVSDLEEFSYEPSSGTLYALGMTSTEGPVIIEFDPATGKRKNYVPYDAQESSSVNLTDFMTTSNGRLCRIDRLGNITEYDMESQQPKTVIDNNWYSPYFSDLSVDEVKLVTCTDDEAVIYSKNATDYSMFFSGFDETVTVLKKTETNPHAGKKVIELATPIDKGMSGYLSNAIYEFNRSDDEYLIRVWSKYKEGIIAGRNISVLNEDEEKLYTMIQELNGSEAPDIAIGIQKNYAMRDDVFEDLTGYLEQDVMDKQFGNIIEASKIGGKQYFLPVTLEIEGLVTDTKLIKNGASGITFEEFDRMIEEDLDGFSPYDYPLSEYNYRKDFLLSCIDTKAAIEGGEVNFGTEQFKAAVMYSEENFAQDGFTKPSDFDWDQEVKRARTECRYDRIESFIEFVHACKSSDGSYTIIGTPSVDASGPRFRALETISVTASSDMKDGAKKFINFLFAGAGYGNSSREFQNIITNKEIMARNISMISEKNNTGEALDEEMSNYVSGVEDLAVSYGYKKSTKDMEEQMMNSLSSITTYYYDDPVITAFLVEEIAPYYAGDRTLDDAVKILNDRTNKYIKEM